jgi:predicted short-subunit dehydrogenase-like oxidoreductase (DUF2520 family)
VGAPHALGALDSVLRRLRGPLCEHVDGSRTDRFEAYRQFADREGSRVRLWGEGASSDPDRFAGDIAERSAAETGRGDGGSAGGVDSRRGEDSLRASMEADPQERRPEGAPTVGIVGAGAVGTALGVAISRAGWPVKAVASRDRARRDRFVSLVASARAFIDPIAVVDEVELVVLAVPDDVIPLVVEPLRLYGGQAMVHTSGLLGAEVLQPALAAGSQIGAFHPLASFTSDVERSVDGLRGATIALEGDDRLMSLLADLAESIGGLPVRLPPGSKPAYHAAAVLAAGGLIALLDAIVDLGGSAGIDERGCLAIYGRLMEQTLANARVGGVASALTGPIVRGDAGTLEAHLLALREVAPDVLGIYRALARREVEIAEQRGALTPEQVGQVIAALAKDV